MNSRPRCRFFWKRRIGPFELAILFILYIASRVLTYYLRLEPTPLWCVVIYGSLVFSLHYLLRCKPSLCLREKALLGSFSALLSLSIVLGRHIIIGENPYGGLLSENYIEPYRYYDVLALLLIIFSVVLLVVTIYILILRIHGNSLISRFFKDGRSRIAYDKVDVRLVIWSGIFIFICWLPYYLTYWPGFIFGDTIVSLSQAYGYSPLSNHHPVVFTYLLKMCLYVSQLLSLGPSVGIAIYSLFQMLIMASCFGFMLAWLRARFNASATLLAILAILFAGSTYMATFSIALWKDPIFSISLMMVSLLLFDFVLYRGFRNKRSIVSLGFFLLCMTFLRSNGFYITTLLFVIFIILCMRNAFRKQGKESYFAPMLLCMGVSLTYVLVTGPIYQVLGVQPSEPSESLGIPLNQMARVVALDGDMSPEDKEFMNDILPLDLYTSTYRPCCTDLLKWDGNFNNETLKGTDFWVHWLSMLIRNPRVFFEAWELQTCGYWAINIPAASNYTYNISGGVPRYGDNISDLEAYDIVPKNLLGDFAYVLFPVDGWSIPGGLIFWILLFVVVVLLSSGSASIILALSPSLGLVFTLLIASPIWYWPRYVAPIQILLPFYFMLLLVVQSFRNIRALNNNNVRRFDVPSCQIIKNSNSLGNR